MTVWVAGAKAQARSQLRRLCEASWRGSQWVEQGDYQFPLGEKMEIKDKMALAAAIVAGALAAAKLVADKESKISDFRKEWIASFRLALAECLAEAHVIAGRIKIRMVHQSGSPLSDEDKSLLEKDLKDHWKALRLSYRTVLLHLNFAETGRVLLSKDKLGLSEGTTAHCWELLSTEPPKYADLLYLEKANPQFVDRLERASPAALQLTRELDALIRLLLGDYTSTFARYDDIERHIVNATLLGNLAIKPEWNRIKRGELSYRLTIWFSVILIVGALLAMWLT